MICFAASFILACVSSKSAPRIDIDVTLRPSERLISESGSLELSGAEKARPTLYFQLAAGMRDVHMEIVKPSELAAPVELTMINDNGFGSGNWTAVPKSPIPPNTPIQIKFSCQGGDKTSFVFHIGEDGSFSSGSDCAWYPQFGEKSEVAGKFDVDSPAGVVGHIRYHYPQGLTIVSTGKPTTAITEGHEQVARFEIENPSSIDFDLDQFHVYRSEGTVPVSLYFKVDRPDAQTYLQGIRKVVDTLSSIYGKFPFAEFSLVEASDEATRDAGFGGAGCAGFMISVTSFLNGGFNLAFFGHEIGHQWWGNLISQHGPEGGYLLSEAMAQYGSLFCVTHIAGESAAERYRHWGYPGYLRSQCGEGYLQNAAAGTDHTLGNMSGPDGAVYHELADEKGFLVFDQLRREIGDNAFHSALMSVTSKFAYQAVTWQEFKDEVEAAAHRKLEWFWSQWYTRLGAPYLDATWKQDGQKLAGLILQSDPPYRLRVPVRIDFSDGSSEMRSVDVQAASTPFAFEVSGAVSGFDVDPHFEVLHYSPESKARSEALVPFTKALARYQASHRQQRDEFDKAVSVLVSGIKGPDDLQYEFDLRLAWAQELSDENKLADAAEEASLALQCPSRQETLVPDCYYLVMKGAAQKGDSARARWAARAVLLSEKARSQHTSFSDEAVSVLGK